MKLSNRKIILGITGGIAAYKSAYLTRLLTKAGAEVQVIMTEAAAKFVTPLTFESLTAREVPVEMFPENRVVGTRHITLAEWPDLIIVAPATADFLAQAANGHCPSLLAAILCATRKKVVMAPSMNEGMYAHPAVQKNIATLRGFGYRFAEVGVGMMSCQSYGPGRMAEPGEIFDIVVDELDQSGPLRGKRVLVTAGPSREAIDPVRFISNCSSGKMGFAVAKEAQRLGAEVTLITGPVSLLDPPGINIIKVSTTEQMARSVETEFTSADYLVMAAAPADYKATQIASRKIKKGTSSISLELTPTIDILKGIAPLRRKTQIVVGFSLETENEIENSRRKLSEKQLDHIVVNNPLEEGAGFEVETNRVTILSKNGDSMAIDKADKETISCKIWEYVLTHGT